MAGVHPRESRIRWKISGAGVIAGLVGGAAVDAAQHLGADAPLVAGSIAIAARDGCLNVGCTFDDGGWIKLQRSSGANQGGVVVAEDQGVALERADQLRGRWSWRSWRSWRSWLGVVAAWLAGIVCLMLVAFFVYAATYDSNPSDRTFFLVITGLVVVPAVALWWTHNRYWYSFAGGMVAPWAALMLFLFVEGDGGPTAEELDRKADRIAASGTPAYYLGDNPRGNDLEDIYRNRDSGAHGLTVEYDLHCQGDLGCTADVSVDTFSMSTEYLQALGCERLGPLLGVPAARLDGRVLTLFTGHTMISIEDNESDDAVEGELDLAPMLRAFGASSPATVLPAPAPAVLRSVEEVCGAAP